MLEAAPPGRDAGSSGGRSQERSVLARQKHSCSRTPRHQRTPRPATPQRLEPSVSWQTRPRSDPHAGKKVELTGTVQDSDSSSRNSSSASTADSSAPQLVVESGKVLAEKCTE